MSQYRNVYRKCRKKRRKLFGNTTTGLLQTAVGLAVVGAALKSMK